MTVLMTADVIGGVWTHALDLARGLGACGVHVVLAAMGGPVSADRRRDAAAIPTLTLVDRPFRLEWMDDAWDDVDAAGDWLLTLAADCRPDVVHVNGFAHASLPFAAPVLVAAHSCVLSWFRAVKRCAPPSSWHRYKQAVTQGLSCARLVVTPTRAMALNLVRDYAPITPVFVIPNGRCSRQYAPAPTESFVFTAGRLWDDAKNVALVAEAAPRLPWPVYAAGEGSEALAGVHGLGPLSAASLAGWYARASIYAHPALYEPFGLSVLEAALSGCALVLGDIPSLRETWEGAACFVDTASADGLADTLTTLIADTRRRRTLATRARAHARRYSVEAMATAYLQMYQQLMAVPAAVSAPGRLPCAS
jgi:glycogen synthase